MPLDKLTIRLGSSTRDALQQRADQSDVTLGSYVAAVLAQHLAKQSIAVAPRKRGLANVDQKRREKIAAGARKAKRSKGEMDG